MGGPDKLLELVDGVPLLARQVARALSVGPTVVTLPSADHPRRVGLPQAAQVVAVTGQMSDSIKAGIAALADDVSGVMILPADMPDITENDIQAIHDVALKSAALLVRATTEDGRAGHPIYFSASQFPRFKSLTGDRGAFHLTTGLETQTELVPLQGNRARLDLDTPDDWAAYRAR